MNNPTITPPVYTVEGAGIQLPRWNMTDENGNIILKADITSLTFTIKRVETGTVVGSADTDGWGAGAGANGVTFFGTAELRHTVGASSNSLETAGKSEHRQVIYTITTAAKKTIKVVDYFVQSLTP